MLTALFTKLTKGITMAEAKRLPSGMWRKQVRIKGFPVESITRRTKKECDDAANKIEQDIRSGKTGKFPAKTILDAFDRYADKVSSTKAGERWELVRLNYFKRQFAALPEHGDVTGMMFYEIDTTVLVDWRDLRLSQVSEGSVKREVDLLRNVFTLARTEWKWTDQRPFEGMRLPRDNPPRTTRPCWSNIRRIVRHLGYRTGEVPSTKSQEIAYAYLLALRTALRPSELLRLSDKDIDMDKRVLRVKRKTYHLTREIREVPFTRAAARLFRPLLGWGGLLFTVAEGTRDALFRKARKQLGIEDMQFRDSRADSATRLVKKGQVNVLQLARILDHKDLSQLNSTYFRQSAADIAQGL
jgi:integrase